MTAAAIKELRPLLEQLFLELRPSEIAEIYCDYGGVEFWRLRRDLVLDLGISWAAELVSRVGASGSSLYVGAGVAELPAMIAETRTLDRKLSVVNLRERECVELNRALRAVGVLEEEILVQPYDAVQFAGECEYDHLSLVSVLDDSELYPQVSDLTYGRMPPVLLDLEAFAAERKVIHALVDAVLGGLTLPGLVTTSFEEVPWILHWAVRAGVQVEPDETTLDTAVVGDPIGFLKLLA